MASNSSGERNFVISREHITIAMPYLSGAAVPAVKTGQNPGPLGTVRSRRAKGAGGCAVPLRAKEPTRRPLTLATCPAAVVSGRIPCDTLRGPGRVSSMSQGRGRIRLMKGENCHGDSGIACPEGSPACSWNSAALLELFAGARTVERNKLQGSGNRSPILRVESRLCSRC